MVSPEESITAQANKVLDQARNIADSIVPGGSDAVSPSVFFGGIVAVLSLLHMVAPETIDETFALVPHHTIFTVVGICPIPFVWNIATGNFYEGNLLKAVLAAPCIVTLTQLLERLWATKAVLVHVLFTVTCSGASFFLTELVHVYQTSHEKDFFIPVCGTVGLVVAIAVGVRHAYPLEPAPLLPRSLGVQCQHLPFAITAGACVAGLLFGSRFTEWLFAPFAFFYGWLHLRYVMWFPHANAHGDHSPDFLFASLFPRPFRPLVGCLGAITHKLVSAVAPSFVQLRTQAETAACGVGREMGVGSITSFQADSSAREGGIPRFSDYPAPQFAAPSGPVIPGGPGSKEYAARRAKALALLDQNIESLLKPQSAGKPAGADPGLDDKIGAVLAGVKQTRATAQSGDLESGAPPAIGSADASPPPLAPAPPLVESGDGDGGDGA